MLEQVRRLRIRFMYSRLSSLAGEDPRHLCKQQVESCKQHCGMESGVEASGGIEI